MLRLNYDLIKEAAEKELTVSMNDRADIIRLQEVIAAAIAKAIEEYDRQKGNSR